MPSPPFADASARPWQPAAPGVERQVLAHDDGLMLVRVRFEAGAVGAVHRHPHRQVSYVEAGVFEGEVGDDRQVLRASDSFVVAPGVPHGVVAREAGVLIDVFSPAREDFVGSRPPLPAGPEKEENGDEPNEEEAEGQVEHDTGGSESHTTYAPRSTGTDETGRIGGRPTRSGRNQAPSDGPGTPPS